MFYMLQMHVMQLRNLDLNLLVVLDALLETENVKAASARLGLSASATSHALARLRELLDDPVLVRSGRNLAASARAQRLRPIVRRLLEDVERALAPERALDPATLQRAFAVAATDYAELVVVAPTGELCASEAPRVDLYSKPLRDLQGQLRNGDADLAIGVFRAPSDDIHPEELFRDELVCLFRRGHPALDKPLGVARYAALDHVLVAPRGSPRGAVDEALAEQGLGRRVARTVSNFLVAPHLVARSDYVLTISARIAALFAEDLDLVTRKPPLPLRDYGVSMAWHARNDADPAHQWLRDSVRSVARTLSAPARRRSRATRPSTCTRRGGASRP